MKCKVFAAKHKSSLVSTADRIHMEQTVPHGLHAHYFLWSEVTRCLQLKLNAEHVRATHDMVAFARPMQARKLKGKFIANMLKVT